MYVIVRNERRIVYMNPTVKPLVTNGKSKGMEPWVGYSAI